MRPPRPAAGTLIAGRFEIRGPLGRGGFGRVLRALDRATGIEVALKLLDRDPGAERRALEAIDHPAIVRAIDAGRHDALHYLAMERAPGETLRDRLDRRGPLAAGEALRLFRPIARAVRAAHAAGIVHRDLKPGNVVIGPGDAVKLVDFGLAAFAAEQGTRPPVGTAEYMSPQHLCGDAPSVADDVHGLGVLLYEMLVGAPPFRGTTAEDTARLRLAGAAPDPADVRPAVPRALGRLVRDCLRRRAAERPQDVGALLDRLERLDDAAAERPTRRVDPARVRGALRISPAAAVAALSVGAAALLAAAAWTPDPGPGTAVRAATLFADGEARIAVLAPRVEADDPASRLVATMLGESVRERLQERRDVRLLALDEPIDLDRFRRYRPEHVVESRVARLGDEIRVVWSVLRLPDRVSVLRHSRTLAATAGGWDELDAAGDAFVAAYAGLLDAERAGTGGPR